MEVNELKEKEQNSLDAVIVVNSVSAPLNYEYVDRRLEVDFQFSVPLHKIDPKSTSHRYFIPKTFIKRHRNLLSKDLWDTEKLWARTYLEALWGHTTIALWLIVLAHRFFGSIAILSTTIDSIDISAE